MPLIIHNNFLAIVFAAFVMAGPISPAKAAADQPIEKKTDMVTRVGDKYPLATECFQNARNADDDPEKLAPCNQSLAEEALSTRRMAVVFANRGVIQFNIGDYDAAGSDFSAALDNGVYLRSRVHANRGLSYEAGGFDALARRDYKIALEINENNKLAAFRLLQLEKPIYDRLRLPRRITAEVPKVSAPGM